MSDLSDFQSGKIVEASITGVLVTKTTELFNIWRDTISIITFDIPKPM